MSIDAEQWKLLPQDHMARSKKLPWHHTSLENRLEPSFQKLLKEWSGIAPDDVGPHTLQTREDAWNIIPLPCIGEFWFIKQGILRHPDYARALEELKGSGGNARFLDLGTCLGQDVRTPAHHGAPIACLYGADVLPEYEAAGHALFEDSDCFESSHFITGDIFSNTDDVKS